MMNVEKLRKRDMGYDDSHGLWMVHVRSGGG